MLKTIGIIAGGIFVGAVAAEVVRSKAPEALKKVRMKTFEITSGAKEAFKKGDKSAAQPQKTATASD